MRRTLENSTLLEWARAFWSGCGLSVDADVFDSAFGGGRFTDRTMTVRLRDLETDILWRFEVNVAFCVRDSVSAHNHVIAHFEEQELRIRQATFYVHHCREVLRAVQQERHERYMQALLEMRPEAQA